MVNDATGLDLPNVMTPGAWVILAIVGGAVLSGFGYLFFKWWTTIRVAWEPFEGYYDAKVFSKGPGFDKVFLVTALRKSEELLAAHTRWTPALLAMALQYVRVYVHADNEWQDLWGQKVAGQQMGHVVAVGRDLAALLHEVAHLCEELIDREIDREHKTWVADGIRAAEAEFAAWIKTTTTSYVASQ